MKRLHKAAKILGLAAILGVNLFVFGSDFLAKYFHDVPAFEKAFLHFSEDHQLNKAPFTLQLTFAAIPSHEMNQAPAIPPLVLQFFFGLMALTILITSNLPGRVCLFRGEKMKATLFIPTILIPPPERF